MAKGPGMKRLLYCQKCGESQIVEAGPEPCRCCGCCTFHREHPRDRDSSWVWPGYTAKDKKWLRSLRIATGDLRFEAMPAPHGWWVVVDHARGDQVTPAAVVRYFGPQVGDCEQVARLAADQLNRDALWQATQLGGASR